MKNLTLDDINAILSGDLIFHENHLIKSKTKSKYYINIQSYMARWKDDGLLYETATYDLTYILPIFYKLMCELIGKCNIQLREMESKKIIIYCFSYNNKKLENIWIDEKYFDIISKVDDVDLHNIRSFNLCY